MVLLSAVYAERGAERTLGSVIHRFVFSLQLFVVGMVTLRVDSRAALTATAVTVLSVGAWLFVDTPVGRQLLPGLTIVD